MAFELPNSVLERASEFVNERMALSFPRERWRDLERGLLRAAKELGFNEPAHLLANDLTRQQFEVLASHLTVGETYLFRDKALFENLERNILPELIQARRGKNQSLRLWSAGCCTGEEAYSIAILLKRLLPDIAKWNITLLATDINPAFLRAASAGEYSEWSFRDTPPSVRTYFRKVGKNRSQIDPSLKRLVKVAYLNLAEDTYPSLTNGTNAMDLVLCRNVLMYFSPDQVDKVVKNLTAALVDGGYLVVAATETLLPASPHLSRVNVCGSTVFRKTEPGGFHLDESMMLAQKTSDKEQPSVVTAQPEKPAISDLFQEALSFYNEGRNGDAADKLGAILSRDAHHSDAAALLARIFANEGKLVPAMQWADIALIRGKLKPELHYLRATILQEQDVANEAARSLERALYLDPGFVLAQFALGNLALQQNRHSEAERFFLHTLFLLDAMSPHEVLPASDGMTAGRLKEITRATLQQEQPA